MKHPFLKTIYENSYNGSKVPNEASLNISHESIKLRGRCWALTNKSFSNFARIFKDA